MSIPAIERIEAAIRLEKPDRVPVAPIIDFFSSRYGGITQHEMFFDLDKADMALEKTIEDLGYIDAFHLSYAGLGRTLLVIFPTPPRLPGVDGVDPDGQFQFVEKSVMEPEEYRLIMERGALLWMREKLLINHPWLSNPVAAAGALKNIVADNLRMRRSIRRWRKKGVESMVAYNLPFTPMEWVSMAYRSFNDMILDLYRRPEEVKEACKALRKPLLWQGLLLAKLSGVRRVFLGGTRTSASCISPAQFEEFALPEWEYAVDYFVSRGYTPILHFDSDWTAFFPYLKHLPRGKCVLNLDGTSDIFKAKEILGDHMCLMGDVPATLLKLGEPEEVDQYCRRLITELGADGGFILSSGCTTPVDARTENVKAMIQSVQKYEP
ncbi:MAG: uroporphyrinogen decarboxylase family protein [Actinomycetota bacterium]